MLTSCFDQILKSIAYWIPFNLLLYRTAMLIFTNKVVHDLSFCMYAIATQALIRGIGCCDLLPTVFFLRLLV
jgi:hypothetical protein